MDLGRIFIVEIELDGDESFTIDSPSVTYSRAESPRGHGFDRGAIEIIVLAARLQFGASQTTVRSHGDTDQHLP